MSNSMPFLFALATAQSFTLGVGNLAADGQAAAAALDALVEPRSTPSPAWTDGAAADHLSAPAWPV